MKIKHDAQHIYLYFDRFEHANNGKIRKEIVAKLKGIFGTPADPEAEEVMHYDGNIKARVFEYSRETIDKLRELVGTA